MKEGNVGMRPWILRGGVVLLGGMLLAALFWALFAGGHNPNHDIDIEKARAAAARVHRPPSPDEKRIPGAGG